MIQILLMSLIIVGVVLLNRRAGASAEANFGIDQRRNKRSRPFSHTWGCTVSIEHQGELSETVVFPAEAKGAARSRGPVRWRRRGRGIGGHHGICVRDRSCYRRLAPGI